MKKILILLLATGVAFTSCKKDEPDPNDNNNNNTPAKKIDILEIRIIDWTDDQGNTWDDDGTGPDVQIKFGPNSAPAKYSSPIRNDIVPQHGAIPLDINPDVSTTKETWTFTLWDIDNFGTDRVMYTWTYDFNNVPSNTIDIHQGSWFLRIKLKD